MKKSTLLIALTALLASSSADLQAAEPAYSAPADLVTSPADDGAMTYYTIASPRGGFLTASGDSLSHQTLYGDAFCYWYLESTDHTPEPGQPVRYNIRNAATGEYINAAKGTLSATPAASYIIDSKWQAPANGPWAGQPGICMGVVATGAIHISAAAFPSVGVTTSYTMDDGTTFYFTAVTGVDGVNADMKARCSDIYERCGRVPALFDASAVTDAVASLDSVTPSGDTPEAQVSSLSAMAGVYEASLDSIYKTADGNVVTFRSVSRTDDKAGYMTVGSDSTLTLRGGTDAEAVLGDVWTAVKVEGMPRLRFHRGDDYISNHPAGQQVGWTIGTQAEAGDFSVYGPASGTDTNVSIGTGSYSELNNKDLWMNASHVANKVVSWIAYFDGINPGAGWTLKDESGSLKALDEIAAASGYLKAMQQFPAGTFDAGPLSEASEAIKAVNIPVSTPLDSISQLVDNDLTPAFEALAKAAESADGKVVALKSKDNPDLYLADTGTDNLATLATTLKPEAAWVLKYDSNLSFRMANVSTGRYIGNSTAAESPAAVPITDSETDAAAVSFEYGDGMMAGITGADGEWKQGLQSVIDAGSGGDVTLRGRGQDNSTWTTNDVISVPESITVDPATLELVAGKEAGTVTAMLTPSDITPGFDAVEFALPEGTTTVEMTSDGNTATITPKAEGTVTITVTSPLKGLTITPAEATVTVTAPDPTVSEWTGIETVNADAASGNATVYDLAGRRLTRIAESGIYIVNGTKILVK